MIEERQGGTASTNVHYQYVYGASGNLVLRDTYSGGTIVPASRLYALWDANGDVTAITNTSGTVVERYEYSPYGTVTVLNASGTPVAGNVSAYGWQYLYQGGRQDAATGMYLFEHRDYNPASGTWIERDPMGLAAGDDNLYGFVSNNPIELNDPSGLAPKLPQIKFRDGKVKNTEFDLNSLLQISVNDINRYDLCDEIVAIIQWLVLSIPQREWENTPFVPGTPGQPGVPSIPHVGNPGYRPETAPAHADRIALEKKVLAQLIQNWTKSDCGRGKGKCPNLNGPSSSFSNQPSIGASGSTNPYYDPHPNVPLWYRIEMGWPETEMPSPVTVPGRVPGQRVPRTPQRSPNRSPSRIPARVK